MQFIIYLNRLISYNIYIKNGYYIKYNNYLKVEPLLEWYNNVYVVEKE